MNAPNPATTPDRGATLLAGQADFRLGGFSIHGMPLDAAAIVEVDAPDGGSLISRGDAAGERLDLAHLTGQVRRAAFGLFQLDPNSWSVRWDPGHLLQLLGLLFSDRLDGR